MYNFIKTKFPDSTAVQYHQFTVHRERLQSWKNLIVWRFTAEDSKSEVRD